MQVFEVVLQFLSPERQGFLIPAETSEKAVEIAKTQLPGDVRQITLDTVKEVIYHEPVTLN